ncbi:MAG: NifB/NifX family molybdenum-iron cluster-binding protein [Candidatus Methanomethylophilaceae archaeon]
MKIAIACDGKNVTEHFGHCESYRIYETKDGKITDTRIIDYPGHRPNFLPTFLKEHGADVIISGGMGETAINMFNESGIEVIVGAVGDAETVAKRYLNGDLVTTGTVCREHMHHDECESQ